MPSPLLVVWIAVTLFCLVSFAQFSVTQTDFVSDYCAGAVLNTGQNPYEAAPLSACEAAIFPKGFLVPAPLPPYALLPYRLVALLPFRLASDVWRILLALILGLSVLGVAALCRINVALAAALIVPISLSSSVPLGQLYPIILCMMIASALCFKKGRGFSGGLLLSATMLEPNVGLPCALSAFFLYKNSRIGLCVGAAAAVFATVLSGPISLNAYYVFKLLPVHAINETKWMLQYSLSHALFSAGLPAQLALRIGQVWYAGMVIIGLYLARAMFTRGLTEGLVLAPSACSAFGGAFVHLWQMAIGGPLGAVLAMNKLRNSTLASVGVLLLSSPWIDIGYPIPAALAVLATYTIGRILLLWSLRICLASAVCVSALAIAVAHSGPMLSNRVIPSAAAAAGVAEAHPLAIVDTAHEILSVALKLPSWAGLGCILIATIVAITGRSFMSRSPT